MLSAQTSNLTPGEQQRLYSDFLVNEQSYLQMRDELLPHYGGQWVAVHNGTIVAADKDLLRVTEKAARSGGHPYIALVGAENAVGFRVRRVAFPYDQTYQPVPLPRMTVTFWNHGETHSQTFTDVIPDTGADLCLLPDTACQAMDLFNSPYFTATAGGVLGGSIATLIYSGKAELMATVFPP